MNRLELVVQTERALANVNDSALALVKLAESLEGERKFVVQQIAWAIQDELETISRCVKQDSESDGSSGHDADQANVIQLGNQKSRDQRPGT